MRLLKLTLNEVSSIPPSTPVYEGVGKMFVYDLPTRVERCLTCGE